MEVPTQTHHKHMLQSEEVAKNSIFDIIFSFSHHLLPQRKVISPTPTPFAAIQEAKEVTIVSWEPFILGMQQLCLSSFHPLLNAIYCLPLNVCPTASQLGCGNTTLAQFHSCCLKTAFVGISRAFCSVNMDGKTQHRFVMLTNLLQTDLNSLLLLCQPRQ